GLFVNTPVYLIPPVYQAVGLDLVQLSGDESPAELALLKGMAFKAIRPGDAGEAVLQAGDYLGASPTSARYPSLLVDAHHPGQYGGTGLPADDAIALAAKACVPRLMLAGGLTPENVAARIAAVQPWGVDVASGVESGTPGIKDLGKMRAFVAAAHGQI
ncbi:MAG: phosphoribosylanthranilate isomerase, partial [Armatimonadetes bacterium]|nr:phosphoribosylanthranilate isomerase [Anaerolineae bacterium]